MPLRKKPAVTDLHSLVKISGNNKELDKTSADDQERTIGVLFARFFFEE